MAGLFAGKIAFVSGCRVLLVFALLGATVLFAAPSALAISKNDAGLDALRGRDPASAVLAFESALQAAPDSVVVSRNLAAALSQLADLLRERKDSAADPRADQVVLLLDRAIELHPERIAYRVQRGRARYEQQSDTDRLFAREDFEWVLEREPNHLAARVNLGQVAYDERVLSEAVEHWSRAAHLRPSDPDIANRLERARREFAVESSFEEIPSPEFLVRFGKSIPFADASSVAAACQEAYSVLCRRFGHFPGSRTVVTIYTPKEFRAATRLHHWVAGVNDGTIRVALPSGPNRLAAARRTIHHEFAHQLIRGIAPNTPGWLHEGLAQLAEGKDVAPAEDRLRRGRSAKAGDLSGEVLRQPDPRRVSRFYDLALAFTAFLTAEGGEAGILKLLHALAEAKAGTRSSESETAALRAVFGAGRSELFARWQARLKSR